MQVLLPYLIAGWSGFFVMGVELLGGRLLAPTFGSSIYVWGAIITVFMLALSLGYLAGGWYSMHAPSVRRLGGILLIAALTVLPVLLFAETAARRGGHRRARSPLRFAAGSDAAVFLPTFFSGMVSPYAVRLLVQDRASSGRHAGQLYFVSTFGSAAGTLLTSFYLVLIMEVDHILLAMLAISAVISSLCVARARGVPWLTGSPRGWRAAILLLWRAGRRRRIDEAVCIRSARCIARCWCTRTRGVRCMCFHALVPHRAAVVHGHGAAGRIRHALSADDARRAVREARARVRADHRSWRRHDSARAARGAFPRRRIDVVEIDPAVVRVAKEYFDFRRGRARTRCHELDGRVFVKRAIREAQRYDLIMLDAFDHEYIPEHLLTREFLREVKSLLAPDGVLAANTFSSSRLYDHESTTYAAVFPQFFNLKRDNRVIIAVNGALPDDVRLQANSADLRQVVCGEFGFGAAQVAAAVLAAKRLERAARAS